MNARSQLLLDIHKKLIVDLFAGGGGMSTAFEMAFGRSPDIAINHNEDALSMHRANHPQTRHFIADVFEVCPKGATQGRPVGWLHLSPDCTHHSQAAGGQPRSKKIRGLSWVGYRWAGQVSPDVVSLENVMQIKKWGPLVAKRDKITGRVMKLDGTVAATGERVPVQEQYLVPDTKRAGQTWRKFIAAMEQLGYAVEYRTLCAADFGGHTTRERLFMIARRDGQPIQWPAPTHARAAVPGRKRWLPAADCIDWSIACPSIFERKKPLAAATLRRIAKGIKKYVLDSAQPFIVPIAHYNGRDTAYGVNDPLRTITAATKGGEFALAAPVVVPATHQGGDRVRDIRDPLPTVTAAHRRELMAATPIMVNTANTKTTGRGPNTWPMDEPLKTITTGNGQAVTTAYLAQMNGGFNETPGHDLRRPMTTVTNSGSQQQLVTAHLATLRRNCVGKGADEPLPTLTAGAEHHCVVSAFLSSYYTDDANRCRDARDPAATITTENRLGLIECTLAPEHEAGALQVAAFLMRYYGEGGQWGDPYQPVSTITTRDRLALVTVILEGVPHVIVDIGLRMLQPRELYRAQDFPETYIIDRGHDGRGFSKTAQVRMVGNSVDPVPAAAFLRANAMELAVRRVAA